MTKSYPSLLSVEQHLHRCRSLLQAVCPLDHTELPSNNREMRPIFHDVVGHPELRRIAHDKATLRRQAISV